MHALSATRRTPLRWIAPLVAASLALASAAHASDHPCLADDNSFACRLTGLLHWLEAAAWILAIILVAVIAVAVHLYRKNRKAATDRR